MNRLGFCTLCLTAVSVALAGCATSPALKASANHGASLVAQLETELAEFRRVRQDAAKARASAIAAQQRDIEFVVSVSSFDGEVRAAMGDDAPAKLSGRLTVLTDSIAKGEQREALALARVDAQLAELLKPLPSTAKSTTAAQKAIVVMGEDLDWATQAKEARAFYDEVAAAVRENRKKIRDAEDAAAKSRDAEKAVTTGGE